MDILQEIINDQSEISDLDPISQAQFADKVKDFKEDIFSGTLDSEKLLDLEKLIESDNDILFDTIDEIVNLEPVTVEEI